MCRPFGRLQELHGSRIRDLWSQGGGAGSPSAIGGLGLLQPWFQPLAALNPGNFFTSQTQAPTYPSEVFI